MIIPTYNRAAKCLRAVESALCQTHGDVEVVVIDDGSTDGTAELICGVDPRVRYVWQENAGVAAARNRGLREATGSYVAFLDSDDRWMARKLELQLRVLARFPDAGMVWSDMEAVREDGCLYAPRYLRTMYAAYGKVPFEEIWEEETTVGAIWPEAPAEWASARVYCGDIYAHMFMGSLVHTSTVVLTDERRRAVGAFDQALSPVGEDYEYHFRTCALGRVAFVDVPTIHYQVGAGDQLTAGHLSETIARSNLITIQRAWDRDRQRITLPPARIRRRWAESHRWLGVTLFDRDPGASREQLLRSLRHDPFQWRTLALALLTLAPRWLVSRLREARAALSMRS